MASVFPELGIDLMMWLYILTLAIIPVIITQKKNPVAALAWIMATFLLPFFGPVLYLIFGTERIRNRGLEKLFSLENVRERLHRLEADWAPARQRRKSADLHPDLERIIRTSQKFSLFDAVSDNTIEMIVDIEKAYETMCNAIEQAQHHINISFYIFEPDDIGRLFIDLLMKKARQGIQVNFLYDGFGSQRFDRQWTLRREMRESGVKVVKFLPWRVFLKPWRLNLRNHRKILVVDDRIGFTGSLNIGEKFKRLNWRETLLQLQGPAVAQLQWVFCEDWYSATDEILTYPDYFSSHPVQGKEIVQIVASGPDQRGDAVYKAFFMSISAAQKSIYLTTPFFIPDDPLNLALQMAALRNVDVKLLVPKKSDHPLVMYAGRSYYDDLIKAGVEIYEFDGEFIHSKMLVVDNHLTIIGSANADIRSFRYNFEVNVHIYGEPFALQAETIFEQDLSYSTCLTKDFLNRSAIIRFWENVWRLWSPLL